MLSLGIKIFGFIYRGIGFRERFIFNDNVCCFFSYYDSGSIEIIIDNIWYNRGINNF